MTITETAATPTDAQLGLPDMCPGWCTTEHVRALAEGCTFETAANHTAGALEIRLQDVLNAAPGTPLRERGSVLWRADLEAEHTASFWGWPTVNVMIDYGHGSDQGIRTLTVPFTTGEARVIARQLIHFADLADLDS